MYEREGEALMTPFQAELLNAINQLSWLALALVLILATHTGWPAILILFAFTGRADVLLRKYGRHDG